MAARKLTIAITSGEPAGIGPDISLAAVAPAPDVELVLIGDKDLLAERRRLLTSSAPGASASGTHEPTVVHVSVGAPVIAGTLDVANAKYVLQLLDRALAGVRAGEFDAIVTAPVQKSIINDAGVSFSGHTEYLAEKLGTPRPVMLLAAGNLRVALATTHLPLASVPRAITATLLDETLSIIDHDLKRLWGIARPRIAVCGLNPHAGERGHLGREEIDVIEPALERARRRGLDVHGPLPADTLFVPRIVADYDVVLAMYHDQGLPVLKHAGFGHAVNITLGLPIIRTSVDHGTALDRAGSGQADAGSMTSAIALATDFARRARAERTP
jgi:4-hydroxythreonine-4-phosphate dehydrogenase